MIAVDADRIDSGRDFQRWHADYGSVYRHIALADHIIRKTSDDVLIDVQRTFGGQTEEAVVCDWHPREVFGIPSFQDRRVMVLSSQKS